MKASEIFEVVIDNMKGGLYNPHIRVRESIAKRFKNNWRGLVHQDLLEMFPTTMDKLINKGIANKGRELYDKSLFGKQHTDDVVVAEIAKKYYQEVINTI